MINKIKGAFNGYRNHWYDDSVLEQKILYLLGESTEVVSSAKSESSDLYDVSESHASGEQIPNEALVEGALEKITETENLLNDFHDYVSDGSDNYFLLKSWIMGYIQKMKDS